MKYKMSLKVSGVWAGGWWADSLMKIPYLKSVMSNPCYKSAAYMTEILFSLLATVQGSLLWHTKKGLKSDSLTKIPHFHT